ncbi:Uncharacterized protein PCOAH_00017760 [Plasmodium coatneyi]|uniref:Uncharacterized protein n=1 Tax=Plasmodium coatneyi TaxID=208452 RepID=A0A1B1DXB5_9APIC|nr:Uncharacterized protein PCOAH_00017760 [Plasmodium coatneyi]ANQ07247.1 Uncharacterized protein PCOAH_00017760 [Plasmodium coatneyi]
MNKDDIDQLDVFPPDGGGENENDEKNENELSERETCIPILDASSPRSSHNQVGGINQRDNLPETNDYHKGECLITTLGEVVQAASDENAGNTASIPNTDDTLNRDEAKPSAPLTAEGMESAPLNCSINTVATGDSGEKNTTESPPTETPNCSTSISCISTTRNHNTDAHVEMVEQRLEYIPVIGEANETNSEHKINAESKEEANWLNPSNACVTVAYSEELPVVEDCTRAVADVVGEAANCMVHEIANEVASNTVNRGEQLLSLAQTVSSFQAELLEKNKNTFEEVKRRGCLFVLAIQQSFMNKTEKILCTKCSPLLASLNGAHEIFQVILKLQVEKQTSELYLAHFLEKLKRDVEGANKTAYQLTQQVTKQVTDQMTEQVSKEVVHQMAEAQLKISSLSKDRTILMDTIKKWEEHFHQMKSEQEIIHARVKISVHTSFLNFTEYIFHLLLKVHSALCQKSDRLAFLINRLKCIGLDWRASQGEKGKQRRRGKEPRGETHQSDAKIRRGKRKEKKKRKKIIIGRSKTGNRSEGCSSSSGGSSPPSSDSSNFSKSGNQHSCSTSSCGSNSSMCLSNELCLSDLTHMNTNRLTDKGGKKKGRRKVKQLLIRANESKEGKNRARSVDNVGKAPRKKGKRKSRRRNELHDQHYRRKLYNRYRRYKRLYAEELQKNKTLHFLLANKDEEIAQVRNAMKEEMQSRLLLHEQEGKNRLKEINELNELLQKEEISNKKLATRNEEMEDLNKSLKKKLDTYEYTEKELSNKLCELNVALTKERKKNKRLVFQNGKMKNALFRYNHGVNFLDRGRYRRNGKWCVNVSPPECVDEEMGSEADSSAASEEDSNVGSELYSESSEHLYEDEMYALLGTVKKVPDHSTKKQKRKLLQQGKINKAHGKPYNKKGKVAYGGHYQQNEYKQVKLNSCCFSDNSVDVRMPRRRHLPRGACTKGKLTVREKGNGKEGKHPKAWQNGHNNTQHRDPQCAPPNRDEQRLHIDDQIRRDLENFDETKYKKIISDITKEEKVIEKIKEDELYSIFMQNWEESHMGSEEGTKNGPLSWSGSFMHHLNKSVICANQGEGILPGGNYEQVERGGCDETKRGDFAEGNYANAVDNRPDDHTKGAYPCRENTAGIATQREATLMGHHGWHENVTPNYDPKCAGKVHVFPVEETQIANGADMTRGEEEPSKGEGNHRMDTSKGTNDHVGKGLSGTIHGSSNWDVQKGNRTNHIEGSEPNEPTSNTQGEAINEGILKNYETYKKNKDKFIHLTLRKKVTHVGDEHTPTGGGKKKNTSLENVLNKESSKRESKNCSPVYAEEEEAFEMDKNYAPFESAQNGNPLHNDKDMRESIMMHYTYGNDNHRGVSLHNNVHDRSHIAATSYDNTDPHFFQTTERRDEIRKGNVVDEVGEQNDKRGFHKPNPEGERMTPLGMAHNPHTNKFSLHNLSNNVLNTSGESYPPVGGGNSREKKEIPKCENITTPPSEELNADSHQGNDAAYSSYSLSMLMGASRMDKTGCRLITQDASNGGTTLYAATHLAKVDINAKELCSPSSHEEHSRSAANEIVNHSHQKGGHPWDNKNSGASSYLKNEALNEALRPYEAGAAVPKRDSCESASQRKSVGDRGVLSRLLRKK